MSLDRGLRARSAWTAGPSRTISARTPTGTLPDPLFAAAERFAQEHGLSRCERIRRALEEYLDEHRDLQITEQAKRFIQKHGERMDQEAKSMWTDVKTIWDESMGDGEW